MRPIDTGGPVVAEPEDDLVVLAGGEGGSGFQPFEEAPITGGQSGNGDEFQASGGGVGRSASGQVLAKLGLHVAKDSRMFPTASIGNFRLERKPQASDNSDMPETLLKRRVSQRLEDLKINPFEAARRGKLERNFINDILSGKKESVRGPNLVKLGEALRVPPAFFIREDFELDPENIDFVGAPRDPDYRTSELVEVPEYDVRLSAGGGYVIDKENIKDVWSFSRRYLVDELRLKPAALAVVEIEGDSMSPTLWSGDRVIVDLEDTNPAKPGIYALFDSDATVVKRLERVPLSEPPQVVLIPDNKNHNQYTVPAELVKIIGRVVWYARRL